MMRDLYSILPEDPNNPSGEGVGDGGDGGDVFLRGSTPSPIDESRGSSSSPPPEREYTIAVWVLSALLVILSAVLVFVVVHIIYNHQRLRTLTFFPRRRLKAIQERIERRYETIEGWIISKRVQEHDNFCETCVKDFATFDEDEDIKKNNTMETAQESDCAEEPSSPSALDGSTHAQIVVTPTPKKDLELESVQTGERECPICFEEFAVGQVISYSANPSCGHVFHHTCIKEWLVHHVTCPFCRKVAMHVDEYRGKQKHEHIEELLELHSKRSATTYFCIQEGLVTIPCRIRCTNSELKRLQARICDCIVDRKELATMRGGGPEAAADDCDAVSGEDANTNAVAQDAISALEADVSAMGGPDYDPTAENNVEDDLNVFAQGQLEGSQINVERLSAEKDTETRSEQAVG